MSHLINDRWYDRMSEWMEEQQEVEQDVKAFNPFRLDQSDLELLARGMREHKKRGG